LFKNELEDLPITERQVEKWTNKLVDIVMKERENEQINRIME